MFAQDDLEYSTQKRLIEPSFNRYVIADESNTDDVKLAADSN